MRRKSITTALAVCGSVVGAGFASGREIGAFFSRFGSGSLAAIVAAVAVIAVFTERLLCVHGPGGLPDAWRGTRLEARWRALFTLLLIVTGGAMLSGSGEIAALALPIHGARPIGLTATFALALLLTVRRCELLPAISTALTAVLIVIMALALQLPPTAGVHLTHSEGILRSAVSGLCYGGLNIALAVPILAEFQGDAAAQRTTAALTAALLGTLLFLGNALLLRHPQLIAAPMPLIALMRTYGAQGYWLCAAALYLAILTTLLAALKGLRIMAGKRFPHACAAAACIALLGFEQVVDVLYPALGASCFMVLVVALCGKPRAYRT